MHSIIAASTSTTWVTAERDADFTISPETAVAAIERERPDLVFLCAPNNPTGTPVPLETIARGVRRDRRHGVRRRGVRGVHARGGAVRPHPAARPGAPDRLPHDEQGLRLRRSPRRLPRRGPGRRRTRCGSLRLPYHLSALTQAAALGALVARSRDAADGRRHLRAARPHCCRPRGPRLPRLAEWGSTSCSAASTTRPGSGARSSTAAEPHVSIRRDL